MSLLKTINATLPVTEDTGAVTTGSIAGARGMLFGNPDAPSVIRRYTADMTADYNKKPSKKRKTKKTTVAAKPVSIASLMRVSENSDSPLDQTEIMSKLKSLESRERVDPRDTEVFGIEDDDGGIVRVTVKSDQADEFDHALRSVLADAEDKDVIEIPEILYKLKDHFDIVDVVWPRVQEDEEDGERHELTTGSNNDRPQGDGLEDLEDAPDAGDGSDDNSDDSNNPGDASKDDNGLDSEDSSNVDQIGDLSSGGVGGDDSQVQGLLQQVIDMMKSDAEARKADAQARIADAKQREQELGAKTALAKIKQEEQMMDMDDYMKQQKEQEKETKRLAQLARWKRDMSDDGNSDADDDSGMGLPSEENEEVRRQTSRVDAANLARRLMGR